MPAVVTAISPRLYGGRMAAFLPVSNRDERRASGKALRGRVPRQRHGEWTAPRNRRNPVDLVIESSKGRIPELIPIRYGRMMVSPFTFYRGTANIMGADLASMPATGLGVQMCGDCHLLNFGGYATPERRLLFDINDFDETLPGPWEWDLQRLTTSFVLACRSNGFSRADQKEAALECARSYREHMCAYAEMPVMDVWYSSIDVNAAVESLHDKVSRTRLTKRIKKIAASKVTEHDFPKLAAETAGRFVIKDNAPLIYHHPLVSLATNRHTLEEAFAQYRESLDDSRRVLLDRYRLVDLALKVVGIGSVGTLCAIGLMLAANDDPLFLQIKQAGASVLEASAGKSGYRNHGQRVVQGQRLMQSASDIFLGWTTGKEGRHFYIRQLRDMKLKPLVEVFNPTTMQDYARLCGWTLARAHARSGDPAAIAGYLGKSDSCDRAFAQFGAAYADQAERDHAAFLGAIRAGRIEVNPERE
jgi:uncharacterized protein (DUF2252 family)